MRYREIVESQYDPEQDQVSRANLGDTRKPKLTLRDINRLKKIRATKSLETAKKEQLLGVMYGAPDEDDAEF